VAYNIVNLVYIYFVILCLQHSKNSIDHFYILLENYNKLKGLQFEVINEYVICIDKEKISKVNTSKFKLFCDLKNLNDLQK